MQLEAGTIVEGTVTGITKFGAFVELAPAGQIGLVHISEIAANYVTNVADYLKIGQTVSVKVLALTDGGKINLSIKQTMPSVPPGHTEGGTGMKAFHKPAGSGSAPRPHAGNKVASCTPCHANPTVLGPDSFEAMLNKFIKNSNEKISQLKKGKDAGRRSGAKRPK